jgi:hypothetical protein
VETFISYDTYTAYSLFAVLCECESVVIPDEGVSEEAYALSEELGSVEKVKHVMQIINNRFFS